MPFRPASAALSRFIVLDLSRVRSGPTCVRQLADWGANVIMVEPPAAANPGDAPGGARHGPDFQNLHRNKRSITLDLKQPAGHEALLRLVRRADVVVENFRPDVKYRLGIDYESLSKIRPEIVYASISGFGQDGPYSGRPGFDQIAQGLGGLMSVTGSPEQGPMRAGIPVADLSAGLYCAVGILVALLERESTGRGQWVRTSLLEAQVAMLDFQAARWLIGGEVPKQAGNNHPTMIPTGVFRTADGYINIAITGHTMWERLCRALGAQEWLDDPRYKTAALRSQNRAALNGEINCRLGGKTSAEWIERFEEGGVPAGTINTVDKVFSDPQVIHLSLTQKMRSETLERELELVRNPVSLQNSPAKIARTAPACGEHSQEILEEFGFTADEIEALRRNKVV